jgi:hypothetical protein
VKSEDLHGEADLWLPNDFVPSGVLDASAAAPGFAWLTPRRSVRDLVEALVPDALREEADRMATDFDLLGETVVWRTYMRKGDRTWGGLVLRVVRGSADIFVRHFLRIGKPMPGGVEAFRPQFANLFWEEFHLRFLPAGRPLWSYGTKLTTERGLYAAGTNCAYVSTAKTTLARAAAFAMDMMMLGVGVGYRHDGWRTPIFKPDPTRERVVDIEDTREGWVMGVFCLIDSYEGRNGKPTVRFTTDRVRKYNEPINGFGGTASGPEPLIRCLEAIRERLAARVGREAGRKLIVDIKTLLGHCVMSGNVRRSSEIALGDGSREFYALKVYNNYDGYMNPLGLEDHEFNRDRAGHGHVANHSEVIEVGQEFTLEKATMIAELARHNGDPGLLWMDNVVKPKGHVRPLTPERADAGVNPCSEQALEHMELCNLGVVNYPRAGAFRADGVYELREATVAAAVLYAACASTVRSHWRESAEVMARNARMGIDLTGVREVFRHPCAAHKRSLADAHAKIHGGLHALQAALGMTLSKATTTSKPGGSVPLVMGALSAFYPAQAATILRRVIMQEGPLVEWCRAMGLNVWRMEKHAKINAWVIDIPHKQRGSDVTYEECDVWDQAKMAVATQRYYSTNLVSFTLTVKEHEWAVVPYVIMWMYERGAKSVSLMSYYPPVTSDTIEADPDEAVRSGRNLCPDLPQQAISEAFYDELMAHVKPLGSVPLPDVGASNPDRGCSGDFCEIGA